MVAERSISSEHRIQDTELEQGCSTDTEREELNSTVLWCVPHPGVGWRVKRGLWEVRR